MAQVMAAIDTVMQETYQADLGSFLRQINKQRWGLKDPSLTYCLDALIQHFHDARIIIIVRDGRAVANSYIKNKWGVATNTYYGALRWKREVELQQIFASHYPELCYTIKYENLVLNPDGELRRICEFLDEPFAESMLDYDSSPVYIKKTSMNENAFRQLDREIMSKWQKELTPFQIDIFESVAGDLLTQYQYELVGKTIKIPKIVKRWFSMQQRVLGELQLQYRLRSGRFRRRLDKWTSK